MARIDAVTVATWRTAPEPVYRVMAALATAIDGGALHRYARLPANRDLARQYGCSPNTVIRAKQRLTDEYGYLTRARGQYDIKRGG